MNALVYEGPRQMSLREIDSPRCGENDVIVSVKAVGICGSDVHGFMGTTGRRTPPLVMGHEAAGEVVAAGENVTDTQVGDRVVIQPLLVCGTCEYCQSGRSNICPNRTGLGMTFDGAYADLVRVPKQMLYRLPETVSWEHGALVEPLAVALRAVDRTPISFGDSVAIVGAGPIGLLTLLVARGAGANPIVITDQKQHRLTMATKLGADVTVNVSEADPRDVVQDITGGAGVHAVIEAVGIEATVRQALDLVRPGGHVTWIGNSQPEVMLNMQAVVTREITIRGTYGFGREFERAIALLSNGTIDVAPLIEQVAPLREGPRLFHDLASGELDAIKVLFKPESDGEFE